MIFRFSYIIINFFYSFNIYLKNFIYIAIILSIFVIILFINLNLKK